MSQIRLYNHNDRGLFEIFRKTALREGNQSLIQAKIDPDNFDGSIWIVLENGVIASASAIERSVYTGNLDVGRICRYHILKKFRHGRYGFKMLPLQYQWAKETGLKLLYWTHDIKSPGLNMLYQGKKKFVSGENFYFECLIFKSFTLNKKYYFKDSKKTDMLQYIYESKIDSNYQWHPISSVIERDKC